MCQLQFHLQFIQNRCNLAKLLAIFWWRRRESKTAHAMSVFVRFVPILAAFWGISPQSEWRFMSVFVRLAPFLCNCVTGVSGPVGPLNEAASRQL